MADFFYNPDDQFRDNSGVVCAGGSLTFTITGTATAKNVYAEKALTTNLGNVITLDASGRPSTAIWLASDALYRVVLKDSAAVQVWSRDDIGNAAAAGLVPLDPATGTDGQVYTTDGVVASWETPLYVPDPTGHSGKRLGTDGSLLFWEAQSSYDADNLPGGVLDETAYYQIGNTMIQRGSGTAATNGTANVTAAVTFSPAFDSATNLVVKVTPTIASINNSAWCVTAAAISVTAAGFTANFWAGAEHGSTSTTIDSAVTFTWEATGTRAP